MRLYQWVLTAAALAMSLPLAFLLHSQITREQTTGIAVMAGSLLLLWSVTVAVWRRWRGAFTVSLALAALLWLPLWLITSRRIAFMLRHGGMDCAE